MRVSVDELRKVGHYLASRGYHQAAGFLFKRARQLEEAGLDREP